MEKKTYLIVGDNNFWYGTTPPMSEKQAEKALKNTKKLIEKGNFFVDNSAEELYLWEAKEITRIKIDK